MICHAVLASCLWYPRTNGNVPFVSRSGSSNSNLSCKNKVSPVKNLLTNMCSCLSCVWCMNGGRLCSGLYMCWTVGNDGGWGSCQVWPGIETRVESGCRWPWCGAGRERRGHLCGHLQMANSSCITKSFPNLIQSTKYHQI